MNLPQSTVQTFILFLLIAAGFGAGKARILDEATVKQLSRFLVAFVLPCLIVVSMQKPLTPDLRTEAFGALGLSFAVYLVSFPLAFLLVRALRVKGPEAGVHAFSAVFANVAFMGFPVQEALFGKSVLFAASIYNIPFQLLAFSVGAVMVSGAVGSGESVEGAVGKAPAAAGGSAGGAAAGRRSLSARSFVTPAGIASLAGFALFLLGVTLPSPLALSMGLLGDMTTPLSMALIGATLSRAKLGEALADWRLWASSAYRLLLFPVALWLLLRSLGFSGTLLGLPVIMAAMPAAANSSILAAAYGGDHGTASALVFLSTALSLVTIPLLASLLFGI